MVGMATIPVRVFFHFRGQDWTKSFNVPSGITVQGLKEAMLRPDGEDLGATEADTSAFELRRHGVRVPNFEAISQEMAVDFVYLGPEEGARRAAKDAVEKAAYDKAQAEERERQAQWHAQQQRQREKQAQNAMPKRQRSSSPKGPPELVEVTVRHAMEAMESAVTLSIMTDATILDLRRAVMEAIGESRLSEVKLVRRIGGVLTTLSNESEIGDKREFLSMGKKLEAVAPPPDAELTLTVTSEEDGYVVSIALAANRLVRDLKEAVCSQAQRGPTSQVHLLMGEGGRELKDSELLSMAKRSPSATMAALSLRGIKLGPPELVEVVVTRASTDQSLTVRVWDTGTILDLRNAVSREAPGRPSVDDIRVVKPLPGAGWRSVPDGERLNGQRAFTCMGVALVLELEEGDEPQAQATAAAADDEDTTSDAVEIEVTVWLDRSLGISQPMTVRLGTTVLALKEQIAGGDPTGMSRPEDFELGLVDGGGATLDAATRITEGHKELELLAGASG